MKRLTPNLNKRSYTLPAGCKDLLDVLQPKPKINQLPIPVRLNGQIHESQVDVFELNGDPKRLGVMPLAEALALAQARGVDLIEVGPTQTPPSCLLMDFGYYRFLQNRILSRQRHETKRCF